MKGQYVTGRPMLAGATLALADGKTLRISGRGTRPVLNGRPVSTTALPHLDLVKGGVLRFD